MKVYWKAALVAMVLSVGLTLCAQGPWKNPKVAKELGLTPDQIQKLEDLKYQNEKQMIDVRRDLALKRLDLKRELQKDNPDRAALDKLTDETSALRGRMQKLRMNHMLDAKKVFTPEQLQKIKERMWQRRQGMREHRQDRFQQRDFRGGPGQGSHPGRDMAPQQPGPQSGAEMGPEAGPGPGPDGPPSPEIAEMTGPEPGFGDEFDGPDPEALEGPLF